MTSTFKPGLLFAGVLAVLLWTTRPAQALCLLCSCNVSSPGVSFGTYDPLLASDKTIQGNIAVTCSVISGLVALAVAYDISMSKGSSGNYTTRWMTRSASKLNYNLYTNAARTIIWGDNTGGSSIVTDGYLVSLGAATTQNYPIYGKIPMLQNVVAGTYSDSIVVTIVY